MVDNKQRITSEDLRSHPETVPVLLELVIDRATRLGFRAPIARQVLSALPSETFLELYYAKRRESFLTLFAPLYYRSVGEPFPGPLFEESSR